MEKQPTKNAEIEVQKLTKVDRTKNIITKLDRM